MGDRLGTELLFCRLGPEIVVLQHQADVVWIGWEVDLRVDSLRDRVQRVVLKPGEYVDSFPFVARRWIEYGGVGRRRILHGDLVIFEEPLLIRLGLVG